MINAVTNVQNIIPEGSWLGVLGGGQLGRMFAQSAKAIGYRVCVLTPEENSPASQVADETIIADYTDQNALTALAQKVSAVTIEFENIPVESLKFLEGKVPVRPGANVLYITQNRLREKGFLDSNTFPMAAFAEINSLADLEAAIQSIGLPAVLKTAGFGYDGKGQFKLSHVSDVEAAYQVLQGQPGILEAWVDFTAEYSVIGVRGVDGEYACYGPVENRHKNHILDVTLSQLPPFENALNVEQIEKARAIAKALAEKLNVIGLLTVEFFLVQNGGWIVNELAPRPHNSGHYTIDACASSQFDQQVRALCGLPLGDTTQHSDALMLNLLGDRWFPDKSSAAREPNWSAVTQNPDAHLHLYGKSEARQSRKMGHITYLNTSLENALQSRNNLNPLPTKI